MSALSDSQKEQILRRRLAREKVRFFDCPWCHGTGVDPEAFEDDIGIGNMDCETCGGTGQLTEQEK